MPGVDRDRHEQGGRPVAQPPSLERLLADAERDLAPR
jgi:hypothetical protein